MSELSPAQLKAVSVIDDITVTIENLELSLERQHQQLISMQMMLDITTKENKLLKRDAIEAQAEAERLQDILDKISR